MSKLNHFNPGSNISTQSKSVKVLWLLITCLGFIGAGFLIAKSYNEWQKNPIATSITTKPISDLEFPVVTVCPPKDSNTALYHDLVKAGNSTLTEKDRQSLKSAAFDIFMEKSHKDYVKSMLTTSYMGEIDQFLQGFYSLPMPYPSDKGLLIIRMWNLNGTIQTPWFGEDYEEEYYKEDREFLVVLELPKNIQDLVGSSSLTVELEVDTRKDTEWAESAVMYTLQKTENNWEEAESYCQEHGGHLASVTSEEDDQMLRRVWGSGKWVWLGGRFDLGKWSWSDNSTWEYTNWLNVPKDNGDDGCVLFGGGWNERSCKDKWPFICQSKKSITLSYTKDELDFSSISVWYKYKAASQELLDSWKDKRMTGFRFSWKIENPKMTWTSNINEVGRSIKTHMLDNNRLDYVIKTTLTLPRDLSFTYDVPRPPPPSSPPSHILPPPPPPPNTFDDQKQVQKGMRYKSLVIELNGHLSQADEMRVFTSYKLYPEIKNWTLAEPHCINEGGHLASIHSKWEQELAQGSIAAAHSVAHSGGVLLGGRKKEGRW